MILKFYQETKSTTCKCPGMDYSWDKQIHGTNHRKNIKTGSTSKTEDFRLCAILKVDLLCFFLKKGFDYIVKPIILEKQGFIRFYSKKKNIWVKGEQHVH